MSAQLSAGMQHFAMQHGFDLNDPYLIRRYRLYVDARRDEVTRINAAEKRGEQKGEMKSKLRIAKNLKIQNVDPSMISVATGLTLQEISEL